MPGRYLTSESVLPGHPDKMADAISDAILDAHLTVDPRAKVAVETMLTKNLVVVTGEVSDPSAVPIEPVVRGVLQQVGYDPGTFDAETCQILNALGKQSGDIRQGVDRGDPLEQGAGDQGMVFGYACDETPNLLPLPIELAHELSRALAGLRDKLPGHRLGPDGKTQVTIEYNEEGAPVRVDTVVVSLQHDDALDGAALRALVLEHAIAPTLARYDWVSTEGLRVLTNPTGRFVDAGPAADAGLTGRKIIADTYGGLARHGGGAFSGKDPSKVDRSAAYAARWVAKNVVAAGLAVRCEVQVAYAIGRARPVSVNVDTFGTGAASEELLAEAVAEVFNLSPGAIVGDLCLLRPIYSRTTNYGHFGKPGADLPWEATNRGRELRAAVARRQKENT